MTARIAITVLACTLIRTSSLCAAPYSLIVCGNGGEPEYVERFQAWGDRLHAVLVDAMGHPPRNVRLLTESGTGPDRSSLQGIRKAFADLGERLGQEDDLFVYLVGHGSYRQVAKLNIPGQDLTAGELDQLLGDARARRTAVVNAAPTSGGFVNALSAPGRVICSSTKGVDEQSATRFMEFFLQALEAGSADENRDGRISILETCRQASVLTAGWYTAEGLLATEHAILEDSGDGQGTRLVEDVEAGRMAQARALSESLDGDVAARVFIRDWTFPPGIPSDWIDAYLAAIDSVEAHVARKEGLDRAVYDDRLETLLVKAARLHRRIRKGR